MTDFEGIALIITAAGTLITAIGSVAGVIISARNSAKLNRQADRIEMVQQSTNGLKDQLVDATARGSHAQGLVEGRQALREEIATGKVTVTNGEKP